MSVVTTTSLLLPQYSGYFNAEVIGADPTATTFILDCDYDKYATSEDCHVTSQTFIVGPWADKTLSPGAPETGIFRKIYTQEPYDDYDGFEYSAQCEMSRTYASICTTVNIGGNAYFGETATFPRSTGTDYDGFYRMAGYGGFSWVPVTITKGQKYLAAAAEATPTSDSEQDREATSTTSDVFVITGEADSAEATSKAVRARRNLSLWGVVGLLMAVACL